MEQNSVATDRTSNEGYIALKLRLMRLFMLRSSLGQKLFNFVDSLLWTVEKCAEWSLPIQEIEEDGKVIPRSEYMRPLPWFLFLPSLVIMRTIRMTLNLGARIMNYPEITSIDIVKCMQRYRESIRAISTNEEKDTQDKEDKRLSMHGARKALIRSIRLTLSTLSCLDASKPSLSPPPTRIHVNSALGLNASSHPSDTSNTLTEEKLTPELEYMLNTDLICYERIPSSSESEESPRKQDESLNEMIDRLAGEDELIDKDFDPFLIGNKSDSSTTTENYDDDISQEEISAILEEASEMSRIKDLCEELRASEALALNIDEAVQQEFANEETDEDQSSEDEDNQKIENKVKQSEERVEQSSDSEIKQSSEGTAEESSENEVKQRSEETIKQSSEDEDKQSSKNEVEQKCKEMVEQSSESETKQSSEGTSREQSPEEEVRQRSEETVKQSSEDEVKQSSVETVEQSSEETTEKAIKQSPKETTEQIPEEATKQNPKEDSAHSLTQRLSSDESHAKADGRLTSSRSHDSLECYTSDRSSQEGDLTFYSPITSDNDVPREHPCQHTDSMPSTSTADNIATTSQFINGEVHLVSETMISDSKSPKRTNKPAVEKRNTNVSKTHKGKRSGRNRKRK